MSDFFKNDIEECEEEYYRGNPLMLFEAIRRCHQYNMLMPDWIRWELESGLRKFNDAEVDEFGKAFDISKKTNIKNARKKALYSWKVYQRVMELNNYGKGDGLAIGPFMWKEVAKEFPITPSQVDRFYRAVKKTLNKDRKK